MAVTTCIHGFAPGQCLICQTLQGGGADRAKGRPAAVTPRPTPVRPDAVLTATPARRRSRSLAGRAVVAVVVLALVALVAVWIVGLAFAVLRVIELAAVAVLAGWIGYHLGVYRGRHLGSGR